MAWSPNDLMTWCFRGVGVSLYSPGVEREPLDQTDLDVWLRCILGGGGRILQKLVENSPGGANGMVVGLGGPTCHPLVLHFVPVSSGVFYSLLVYTSSRSSFVLFSRISPPSYVFWNNPAENRDSPKLVEFVSLNPRPMYILVFVPFLLFIHI
jgi:hypothetical protein